MWWNHATPMTRPVTCKKPASVHFLETLRQYLIFSMLRKLRISIASRNLGLIRYARFLESAKENGFEKLRKKPVCVSNIHL